MMFVYIGIIIYQGERQDKMLSYTYFGFAFLVSILCVISLIKAESKSEIVKYAMGISSILMFALLLAGIVISKPNSDKVLQIITYSNMALVFIINAYAAIMLIGKPVIQPVFDTSLNA
jgi:uncharacterized membrane protein YcgQ (UPF0703/DUF1980 family)